MRSALLPVLLLCAACGGGGGSSEVTPSTAPARLAADDLDLGPATTTAELVVRLADAPTLPALLEVAIELPNALTLPADHRLLPAVAVPTLDGDFKDGRFVVVCGDAENPVANLLQRGPLFRLQLVTSTPRQPGTYTIRLHDLRAVASDGKDIEVEGNPTSVNVTVR